MQKQLKKNCRQKMLDIRKIIANENPNAHIELQKNALKWLETQKNKLNNIKKHPKVLASYYPVNSEINCILTTKTFQKLGFEICLPVVKKKAEPLIFQKWDQNQQLVKGQFGINIPQENAPILIPDIIFVPMLAFDQKCYRIGYGGGFYDRTISSLKQKKYIISIGIAFDKQKIKHIPREKHDVQLDGVLTEKSFFSK